MTMQNIRDGQAEEYFRSLPPFVQESIRASGLSFATAAELRSFVARLESR
jgi:hypothetical protein